MAKLDITNVSLLPIVRKVRPSLLKTMGRRLEGRRYIRRSHASTTHFCIFKAGIVKHARDLFNRPITILTMMVSFEGLESSGDPLCWRCISVSLIYPFSPTIAYRLPGPQLRLRFFDGVGTFLKLTKSSIVSLQGYPSEWRCLFVLLPSNSL